MGQRIIIFFLFFSASKGNTKIVLPFFFIRLGTRHGEGEKPKIGVCVEGGEGGETEINYMT